ncbi:MAG: hypothetical protein GXP27_22615 [Planctomycetes bacterium]|nr:hypothetical protein [Planctomycetota bacterium]
MDYMKQIAIYKFWIIFGVALLLPPIGWWTATGKLSQEVEQRWSALDSTFQGIPDGANAPNQSWIDAVNKLNEMRKERLRLAADTLWQRQKELMTWPETIQEQMAKCPFRGHPTDREQFLSIPYIYQREYPLQIRELWLTVDPVDEEVDPLRDPSAPRKVILKQSAIPQVPRDHWKNLPPTWDEMWNVQEDYWLIRELLRAVARVNESSSSILDAPIKSVQEVALFGGQRKGAESSGGTTSSSPSMSSGGDDEADMYGGGMEDGEGMEGLEDLAQEYEGSGGEMIGGGGGFGGFGVGASETAGGAGGLGGAGGFGGGFGGFGGTGGAGGFGIGSREAGGFGQGAMAGMDGSPFGVVASGGRGMGMALGPGGLGMGGGATGGVGSAQGIVAEEFEISRDATDRYIDEGEDMPYRTRGFFLNVIIDHRKLPDFMVELANCPFPVQIVRVHLTRLNPDIPTRVTTSTLAGRGAGMPTGRILGQATATAQQGATTTTEATPEDERALRRLHAMAAAALTDPNLAAVAIVGLMTIYNPPGQTEEGSQEAEAAPEIAAPSLTPAAPTPAAATSPAGPTQPAVSSPAAAATTDKSAEAAAESVVPAAAGPTSPPAAKPAGPPPEKPQTTPAAKSRPTPAAKPEQGGPKEKPPEKPSASDAAAGAVPTGKPAAGAAPQQKNEPSNSPNPKPPAGGTKGSEEKPPAKKG